MAVVPELTADNTPLEVLIVAMPVLLLVHTPPETEFVSVVEVPAQTEVLPPMVAGAALTVTIAVTLQLVLIV